MAKSPKPTPDKPKNHYFDNSLVEKLLVKYHETGCTDVSLRNEIMEHAGELIVNVIRTHNLHNIYMGKDESAFNDLYQIAWCSIESTLYKFNNEPGHPKLFNMWSQISRTAILAAIKKDNRDRKNAESYRYYLDEQIVKTQAKFNRFIEEAREVCKYCGDLMEMLDALEKLYKEDPKPYEGFINKLTNISGMSRSKVTKFIKLLKLLSFEITDSPVGESEHQDKPVKPSTIAFTKDQD